MSPYRPPDVRYAGRRHECPSTDIRPTNECEEDPKDEAVSKEKEKMASDLYAYVMGHTDLRPRRPVSDLLPAKTDKSPKQSYADRCMTIQANDGYGIGPDSIVKEGRLRRMREDDHVADEGADRQLNARVFKGIPDLSRGPTVCSTGMAEADFVHGLDTSETKRCIRLAENDESRFVDPGVCRIPVDNIVASWPVGGAMTRSVARSQSENAVRARPAGDVRKNPMFTLFSIV
jgi:hypothetical protein